MKDVDSKEKSVKRIGTELSASSFRSTLARWYAMWTGEEKAHRYALLLLFLAGVALRAAYLTQPMRYDESFTYMAFVSRPLSIGLSWYPYPNNHLFNTLLSHFSVGLFGNEPCAIRLPAFIAGILIIPATYLVIRKLYNKHAALIATALVVPSSQLIDFSTQSRGYTIQVLVFLLLILLAIHILRTDSRSGWIGFAIAAILGFYTVPTTLYFFPPVLIWMLISGFRRDGNIARRALLIKASITCLAVAAVTVLLYVPVVLRSGLSSLVSNKFVQSLTWADFLKGLPGNMKNMWSGWNIIVPLPLALLFLLAFFLSVFFHRRVSRHPVDLTLVIIGWCLLLLFAQRVLPFARSWLPLLPLYLGGASAGLYFMYKRLMGLVEKRSKARISIGASSLLVIALSLILAVLVVAGQTPYQRDELGNFSIGTLRDAESITLFLKKRLKPGDAVYAFWAANTPLEYYFRKHQVPVKYLALQKMNSEAIENAYFIIAPKEDNTPEAVMESAIGIGGFDPSLFEPKAVEVLRTDYSEVLELHRKSRTE